MTPVTNGWTGAGDLGELLRSRLEAERAQLRSRLLDVREAKAASTDAVVEEVGSRDEIGADLRVADRLDAQFREALSAVEEALTRLDDPRFGLCMECERPIPPDRLWVIPEALKCVECQSEGTRERRA